MTATMTKTATGEKTTVDVAANELAEAERRLAELRAERDGLAAERRAAAERVNGAILLTLTRRVDEIATEIAVAEVAVLAARLVHLEAQLPDAEAEYRAAAAVAPLEACYQEAERDLKRAQGRAAAAIQDRRYVKIEIATARRQLAEAVAASGREPGTVMRYRLNRN